MNSYRLEIPIVNSDNKDIESLVKMDKIYIDVKNEPSFNISNIKVENKKEESLINKVNNVFFNTYFFLSSSIYKK